MRMYLVLFLFVIGIGIGFICLAPAFAQQVGSDLPPHPDSRATSHKTLNDEFIFTPPQSLSEWNLRRTELKRQILLANGLWPMPPKTDLKPIMHHPVEREDYTVSGVILEAVPGFFVTGNLYVPKNPPKDEQGNPKKMPGVLCPHGHWNNGRFYTQTEEELKGEIQNGAEKYDPSGRFPLQARCVTLARLGCVVFHYDMIGCADSVQIPHRPGVRESMNTKENWGLFSPQAELRLQNMMGLQTLSSVRALDWLASLPEVDANRIGVTGASGGGTQTFILSAIDDRVAAAFPAVMVSTSMQGGCTCENAPYLRVNTGNVEIAALFAPKPLGMTAADDWTKEMETKGLPALKQLFALYGATDRVSLYPHLQYGHNYNFVSRNDMYGFMNRSLKLGHKFENDPEKTIEQPFEPLSIEEMTVWAGDHAKPEGDQVGDVFERKLLREMDEQSQKQMESLLENPKVPFAFDRFKTVVGGAFETMIGRTMPQPNEVRNDPAPSKPETKEKPWFAVPTEFVNDRFDEKVSAIIFSSSRVRDYKKIKLFVSPGGKQDLLVEQDQPNTMLQKEIAEGNIVVVVDLYGQKKQASVSKDEKPGSGINPNDFIGYEYGYNHPLFAKRVHDLLTAIAVLAQKDQGKQHGVVLVGLKGAAQYAAAARAIAGDAVEELILDTDGFRFANIERLDDPDLFPGAVKYFDLPGLIALSAPNKTRLAGEKVIPPVVRFAFEATGSLSNLTSTK